MRVGLMYACCTALALAACADGAVAPTNRIPEPSGGADLLPASTYSLITLSSLSSTAPENATAQAINDANVVVGYSIAPDGTTHATQWDVSGQATDLGVPYGQHSIAYDVNSAGEVLIAGFDVNGTSASFLRRTDGSLTPIPRSLAAATGIIAQRFGPGGEVVGIQVRETPTQSVQRAFKWTTSGGTTNLHPGSAYQLSFARGVDGAGRVHGWVILQNGEFHAGRWSAAGTFTDLGTLGGVSAVVNAVNAAGLTTGYRSLGVSTFAFTRASSGVLRSMQQAGIGEDVSDLDRVVGTLSPPGGSDAFTFRQGFGAPVALPEPAGFAFATALGVNRCGNAVGRASSDQFLTSNRAVLWLAPACDQ